MAIIHITRSPAIDQDWRPQYEHRVGGRIPDALREIAVAKNMSLPALVAAIDAERENGNLSSTIRLFVLDQAASDSAEKPPPPSGRNLTGSGSYRHPALTSPQSPTNVRGA